MQLCHTPRATSAVFDDPNLVSSAGLVPVLTLAQSAGLQELAQTHLSVPTDKGANAGLKVTSLVAGMVAGADSIDDMALLRHGGMGRVFANAYAPSTLGSFLRSFSFGHVRQLDAVASRFLTRLASQAPLVATSKDSSERVMLDIDDTIIEVHGYAKQGSSYGYSGVRGLNALLATVSTSESAPMVVAQRLRKGSCGSPRGAARLVADALKTTRTLSTSSTQRPLVRADSAFYGYATIGAALRAGADVSVTVRMDPKVKAAIATIDQDAWTPIEYTDAVFDEQAGRWVSRAEVAEIPFTAFTSKKKAEHVTGRLVVRRIPDLNPSAKNGQETLFATWRFHAFFTTTDHDVADTVAADKTHRGHAIIEQVHSDLKNSALAHMPSGVFNANAAWLVLAVMTFNLTRAAATVTGPTLAKATTATIRRKLIAVPARIASSARRITIHLPVGWPWQDAWRRLFAHGQDPPPIATS
ncbi:IS1380 family transposase [Nocardioides glacieisoli]|uniref:IS1380 family transposase n=1 Tax=Nocardioides glacieisoli TaxID=1168730 RepID=A0A4Q2RKZ2_9ACTN|nr:IS1380 family transposase [Nocardioides glacieisoli]RYB88239.1 IS1380 family transposase [Nocardioides glacieisoli]